MNKSRRILIVSIFLLALVAAQGTFADKVMTWGEPEEQTMPASTKLWRGIVNTFTGIGEIIRQPVIEIREEGWWHLPDGIINGVIMSFVRTGAGVFEVFTFPVPFDESIGYESIMDPDYVWQSADE